MRDGKAAVIWSADIPQNTNSTRYQRASVLNEEYDCDFFIFGDPKRSEAHEFDTTICVERNGIISGLSFFLQVTYAVILTRRSEYELVHTSYQPLACLLGWLCSVSGLRWVHDIWDHPILTVPSPSKEMAPNKVLAFLIKYIPYRLSLRALSRADSVVLSLHPSVTESLPVSEENVVHVPNGTDLRLYANIEATPATSPRVVYVGEVSKKRGADTILQATAFLSEELNDFSLVLVGEIQDSEWLNKTIKKYGIKDHVEMTGYIPHRTALEHIKSADIGLCLFPRSAETEYIYPIKVFEYMALGTIPICTDLAGMSDVITAGEDGFLIKPDDPQDVTNIILSVDCNEAETIANRAKDTVKEYDWRVLNELFRTAIGTA